MDKIEKPITWIQYSELEELQKKKRELEQELFNIIFYGQSRTI